MANRVVAVDNSLSILVQAGENVGDVVREESLAIEHGGSHLGNSWGGHRPPVGVTVSLQTHLSNLSWR